MKTQVFRKKKKTKKPHHHTLEEVRAPALPQDHSHGHVTMVKINTQDNPWQLGKWVFKPQKIPYFTSTLNIIPVPRSYEHWISLLWGGRESSVRLPQWQSKLSELYHCNLQALSRDALEIMASSGCLPMVNGPKISSQRKSIYWNSLLHFPLLNFWAIESQTKVE